LNLEQTCLILVYLLGKKARLELLWRYCCCYYEPPKILRSKQVVVEVIGQVTNCSPDPDSEYALRHPKRNLGIRSLSSDTAPEEKAGK
jgi:hypothetical protein